MITGSTCHWYMSDVNEIVFIYTLSRDPPNFSYGFGAETVKMSPVSVSAMRVTAKLRLLPKLGTGFGQRPNVYNDL